MENPVETKAPAAAEADGRSAPRGAKPLAKSTYEAFARARARGLNLTDAYAEAGFAGKGNGGGSSGLAKRSEVIERIDFLVATAMQLQQAGLEQTIIGLLDLASKTGAASAAAAKESRLARLEAYRLACELDETRAQAAYVPEREMTEDEWVAKYGQSAPPSR